MKRKSLWILLGNWLLFAERLPQCMKSISTPDSSPTSLPLRRDIQRSLVQVYLGDSDFLLVPRAWTKKEKIFFLLLDDRSQEFLGFLFTLSKANANSWENTKKLTAAHSYKPGSSGMYLKLAVFLFSKIILDLKQH